MSTSPMKEARTDMKETAKVLVSLFPKLACADQKLSVELYRLLAEGEPVSIQRLAERLGRDSDGVADTLRSWPGVFFDEHQDVIGYWGLSPKYETPHILKAGRRTLYAWCAWDTLFLPALLGRPVDVESISPASAMPIRLTVTPNAVRNTGPGVVVMSFMMPDRDRLQQDVLTSFCHFLHFFPSSDEAEAWIDQRPGITILTLDAAFELGWHKNRLQYPDLVL